MQIGGARVRLYSTQQRANLRAVEELPLGHIIPTFIAVITKISAQRHIEDLIAMISTG